MPNSVASNSYGAGGARKFIWGSRDAGVTFDTTGAGTGKDLRGCSDITFGIELATAAGTNPTVDAKVQHSDDGSNWYDAGISFTQMTAIGGYAKVPDRPLMRFVRLYFTIGGTSTPSYVMRAWVAFTQSRAGGCSGVATES